MALNINTNIGALGAAASASAANRTMESAMERLSTGLRINTAADDAAGMAISSRMEAQIRGLNQAIRNAADGQALIDTTEGAHQEVTNILQRMRELAVQSANDTNVARDRANIQAEVTQLQAEIDRIAGQTTWNGMQLLNGSFQSKQLQIGADGSQTITFGVNSVNTSLIGSHQIEAEGWITSDAVGGNVDPNAAVAGGYVVAGSKGTGTTAAIAAGATAKATAAAINAITDDTGVAASAVTNVKIAANTIAATAAVTGFTIGTTSANAVAVGNFNITATDLTGMLDAINAKAATTGITASFGSTKAEIILTDVDGDDIYIDDFVTDDNTAVLDVTLLKADGVTATTAYTVSTTDKGGTRTTLKDTTAGGAAAGFEGIRASGSIVLSDTAQITVTGGTNRTADAITGTAIGANAQSSLAAVSSVDVTTGSAAALSISKIDGAIDMINAARANLGAVSNRLDNTISNLTNISTNVASSQSRIQDADFAAESTNLAKAQILQQAATAMLAQANASKQGVLSLLQG